MSINTFTKEEEEFYSVLKTNSRRALMKKTKKWGHPYHYEPRGDLLVNLSKRFNCSKEEAYQTLLRIKMKLDALDPS